MDDITRRPSKLGNMKTTDCTSIYLSRFNLHSDFEGELSKTNGSS